MYTKILQLAIIVLFLVSCNFHGVRGNGELISEIRDVENFQKVDVSGNYDVEIIINNNTKVEVFAESNLLKYIKTRVKNDVLYIYSKKNLRPREDLKILIETPNLYAIDCSGVNDIFAKGINSDQFNIDLSGAGSINISGRTQYLNIDVSGAADLMAKEFITENIKIDVSGAANAEVYASKSCNAEVSGAGYIELYGEAEDVKMDISGAGSLERK